MTQRRILDRMLTPEWMDVALRYARATSDPDEARDLVEIALRDEISSDSNRKKTVTALANSWINPGADAAGVVAWGVEHASGDIRPWHLGVILANYPFFADVCGELGRQLKLGHEVRLDSLRSRLKLGWGDRVGIDIAARAAMRTLRAFAVLEPTDDDKVDVFLGPIEVPEDVHPWLVDALLVARGDLETDTARFAGASEMFLFSLPTHVARSYPNLEFYSEGGGRVVVRRKVTIDLPDVKPRQLTLDQK